MLSLPIASRSFAVLAWLAACSAAQAQGAAPAAGKGADTPLKQCSAANRAAVAELAAGLDAANRRNRLNPVVMSRLHAIEGQLTTLKTATARDARNLRECELTAQSIGTEVERLQRAAGPDPQVVECMAANQQAMAQAEQGLAALSAAARAQPAAQALATRLAEMRPALAREGQSLADCRQVSTAVAQERAQVQVLAAASATPAPDSRAVDACRAANIDAYGDALRAWRDWASILGVSAGAGEYDAAMLRLRRLRDEVARPGGTLADCETMARAIAQERARAPRPAGAAAPPLAASPAPSVPTSSAPAVPTPSAPVPTPSAPSPTTPAAPAPGVPAPAPAVPGAATPSTSSGPAAVPGPAAPSPPAAPAPAAAGSSPAPTPAPGSGSSAGPLLSEAAACRALHGPTYNGIVTRFSRMLDAGGLTEPVRQRLRAVGDRLTAIHEALSGESAGAECAAIGRALIAVDAELR